MQKRCKADPMFKLNKNISNLILHSLKGSKNGLHWETIVGYTCKDLKQHLEKQFDNKMNWDNYGSYWHLDHIIPKSFFKFTTTEETEFKMCWSLNNLQPLEAIENMKKHNKLNYKTRTV